MHTPPLSFATIAVMNCFQPTVRASSSPSSAKGNDTPPPKPMSIFVFFGHLRRIFKE